MVNGIPIHPQPRTSAVYIITPQSSILHSRQSSRHYNADTPATTTFRPIGGHKQGALTLKEVNDIGDLKNCEVVFTKLWDFFWEGESSYIELVRAIQF